MYISSLHYNLKTHILVQLKNEHCKHSDTNSDSFKLKVVEHFQDCAIVYVLKF